MQSRSWEVLAKLYYVEYRARTCSAMTFSELQTGFLLIDIVLVPDLRFEIPLWCEVMGEGVSKARYAGCTDLRRWRLPLGALIAGLEVIKPK